MCIRMRTKFDPVSGSGKDLPNYQTCKTLYVVNIMYVTLFKNHILRKKENSQSKPV